MIRPIAFLVGLAFFGFGVAPAAQATGGLAPEVVPWSRAEKPGSRSEPKAPKPKVTQTQSSETVSPERDADSPADASETRYALVKTDDDILRIDKQLGQVSFCSKSNGAWRCLPAPMAEEAYLAEIEALTAEIEVLEARLEELEVPGRAQPPVTEPGPAPAPQADGSMPEKTPEPEVAEPNVNTSPRLSVEDEEQLEKMLDFTENAMRRFFGLMQDLRTELEGEKGG